MGGGTVVAIWPPLKADAGLRHFRPIADSQDFKRTCCVEHKKVHNHMCITKVIIHIEHLLQKLSGHR